MFDIIVSWRERGLERVEVAQISMVIAGGSLTPPAASACGATAAAVRTRTLASVSRTRGSATASRLPVFSGKAGLTSGAGGLG